MMQLKKGRKLESLFDYFHEVMQDGMFKNAATWNLVSPHENAG
jgi:hypothetical protein